MGQVDDLVIADSIGCGFATIRGVLSPDEIDSLRVACADAKSGFALRRRNDAFALRNLLEIPAVRDLARNGRIRGLVVPILGPDAIAVKGTFFDKIADANWNVPYHQDLTVAVKSRVDAPDYGRWSVKGGVVQVQAPASVLENMLAVRIHLDDCGRSNGPLRVLGGTHLVGRCSSGDIDRLRSSTAETILEALTGDVILMRPLLLHASSAAQTPGHRRVIHLEFANAALPGGVEWNYTV
jgi:hypothetical protein